mmetsp:Transcript_22623/g.33576  ORF Transcript_22623/g.33576 Transcript_22623/m.33576 type:complete len:94 (-) Transcript_22623:377-658(-)
MDSTSGLFCTQRTLFRLGSSSSNLGTQLHREKHIPPNSLALIVVKDDSSDLSPHPSVTSNLALALALENPLLLQSAEKCTLSSQNLNQIFKHG